MPYPLSDPKHAIRDVRIMEVIVVETITGLGEENNPVRRLMQYWSKSGEFLAERDEWSEKNKGSSCP